MRRAFLAVAIVLGLAAPAVPAVMAATPAMACTRSTHFTHGSTYAQVYTIRTCGQYIRARASFADGTVHFGSWRTTAGKYSVAYDPNGGLREAWLQWKSCSGCAVHSVLRVG